MVTNSFWRLEDVYANIWVVELAHAVQHALAEDDPFDVRAGQFQDHGSDSEDEEAGLMVRESWVRRNRKPELL